MTPTSETRLTLDWPAKELSQNARVHWAVRAKATKEARNSAGWAVRRCFKAKPKWQRAIVSLEFHPPDERRRDMQNCIGASKALVDGIADALGIDDSLFDVRFSMGEPVKGGAVIVTVKGDA